MSRYRTTRQAATDIIALYEQGARTFGVAQAERYHAGLVAAFELLAANPLIARVLHGRQDWERRLR